MKQDTNTETLKRRKRQNSPKEEKIIEEIKVSKISDFSGFAKTCFILSIMSILIFYNPEIDNSIAQEIAQKLVDYLNINELGTDIVTVKKNLIIF
ncbi:hypothetical protein [Spiroplasma endosymbiont of Seladonia tumulorum]|uniref:hypothetical protein n=1 Tax=Spiroplasma endosymbiont of Seladonia tumulorum TaxID=3066321 RepID=UPI0030CACAE9